MAGKRRKTFRAGRFFAGRIDEAEFLRNEWIPLLEQLLAEARQRLAALLGRR